MPARPARFWRRFSKAAGAAWELLLAWATVRLLPFRSVAKCLGQTERTAPDPGHAGLQAAATVEWSIQAVTRRLPLHFTCLMQAMAAQRMLRKRRVPATVFLAMVADIAADEPLSAHAWVRCGDRVVVGACDESRYRVIATFA